MTSRKNDEIDEFCDPDNPRPITLEDIVQAQEKLHKYKLQTPCKKYHNQRKYAVSQMFLKLESLQICGSFKVRGILNALLKLTSDERKLGVVLGSIGNAGLSASYYAKRLGIPLVLVMPIGTSIMRYQKCLEYGSKVVVHGNTLMESQKQARLIAKDRGITYINSRDHPDVLAGYGTLGLEILDQVPMVEVVIVPVGTGGLAAGVATAIKAKKPNVLIYGVQPEAMAAFNESMETDEVIIVPQKTTLAEDIAVPTVGANAYPIAKSLLTKTVLVSENAVSLAMLRLAEDERLMVEGAAACPIAAITSNLFPELKTKIVVCIITGGNIDGVYFSRCLQRGLASEGRLVEFSVRMKDNLKDKEEFLRMVQRGGFYIVSLNEDHKWTDDVVYRMELTAVIQTKNMAHALQLKQMIELNYPYSVFQNAPFDDKRTCPCYIKKEIPY